MLKTIIAKELKRVFSDRRLIFSTFLLPALSIFLSYNLIGMLASNRIDDIQQHQTTVVAVNIPDSFRQYMQNEAKDMADWSESKDIKDSYRESMKEGGLDLIVEFPQNFDESIAKYESTALPNIHIYYNPTEDYSRSGKNLMEHRILAEYQSRILEQRFGNLNKIKAFTMNEGLDETQFEIKNEKKSSGFGVSQILPMLLSIMLFASAMGIGMETIAGEKERGTMGALLLTPVSRNTIALGKMMALSILSIISTLLSVAALIASLPKFMEAAGENFSGSLMYGPVDYLYILVILLLEVGIFVGLICLISVLAKTVKEAGTYMTPAYMVVMMGAFATMFSFGKTADYMYAIPLIGNIFALKSALTFELTTIQLGITISVSLAVITVLVLGTAKAFRSEKIMFRA